MAENVLHYFSSSRIGLAKLFEQMNRWYCGYEVLEKTKSTNLRTLSKFECLTLYWLQHKCYSVYALWKITILSHSTDVCANTSSERWHFNWLHMPKNSVCIVMKNVIKFPHTILELPAWCRLHMMRWILPDFLLVKNGGRLPFARSKSLCLELWDLYVQKPCWTGIIVKRSIDETKWKSPICFQCVDMLLKCHGH